jgi:hypothetical protein
MADEDENVILPDAEWWHELAVNLAQFLGVAGVLDEEEGPMMLTVSADDSAVHICVGPVTVTEPIELAIPISTMQRLLDRKLASTVDELIEHSQRRP